MTNKRKVDTPKGRNMPLTAPKAKQAKPKEKDYKLSDSKGLFMLIKKSGQKYWRFKYRFAGKEKLLSLGVYPEVSLKKARLARDEARDQLANEIDPSQTRRISKAKKKEQAANSFSSIAIEWHNIKQNEWTENHAIKIMRGLETKLFPVIGSRPINEITAPDLLSALRRVESKGTLETAHRLKQTAGQIFRYAIITGRAERDPSADLKEAIKTPKKKHLAALIKPQEVAELLKAIDGYVGTFSVTNALKISPLLFQRPGEIRHMQWEEIDFEKCLWEIPANKMKMRQPHFVPLCKQAVAILKEQYELTGQDNYVFPSARGKSRPMSDNGVRTALRTIGYTNEQMTAHGFRAMARTLLDEELHFRVDYIEHQLAHAVKDPNGRAYNRASHLEERKKMMQAWADYLDNLKI